MRKEDGTMPAAQSKKRKHELMNNANDDPASKKVKGGRFTVSKNARSIAAQASFAAFKHGELDVNKFVKSREYEIRALEQGLVSSKKALSKRAFQLVPKELRRRTASHNAKRVPKRLRGRAKREMKDDNTPTVTAKSRKSSSHMRLRTETAKKLRALGSGHRASKVEAESKPTTIKTRAAKTKTASLNNPPLPRAKFRKRQRDKTWLPTHLFHAKRARMTPPKEPLWRFALPLTPTAKSYRSTHRTANDRGAIAFDMSYISTIQLSGSYASLVGVLQALDASNELDGLRTSRKWAWLRGEIALDLHVHHRHAPQALIAPVTIVWRPSKEFAESAELTSLDNLDKLKGSLIVRTHPSAFMELWEEFLGMSKTVKPAVTVEDLRYELGSIEMFGPASTEALLSVLKPCLEENQTTLVQIAALSNTSLLPAGTVIDMEMQDPRMCQRSKITVPTSPPMSSFLANWKMPAGLRTAALFDRQKRLLVNRKLLSQKAINRRRSEAPANSDPAALENDPRIPVLLFTPASVNGSAHLNKWTILLPWKCMLPVWYALIYTPLSTGMQPRFGGLTELRDISLDHGLPWFPADYPATRSGRQWEQEEKLKRREAWKRRPRSKRVNWQSLKLGDGRKGEVGEGWSCDWSVLSRKVEISMVQQSTAEDPNKTGEAGTETQLHHVVSKTLSTPAQPSETSVAVPQLSLVQVRVEQISRGVAQPCARIYRLPSAIEPRKSWLMVHPKYQNKRTSVQKSLPRPKDGTPTHIMQKQLAQYLQQVPQPGQPEWPACPGEGDLIGFVTAGNYTLGAGRGTAIGSIVMAAELDARARHNTGPVDDGRLCIVRNSGETIGRLAQWHMI